MPGFKNYVFTEEEMIAIRDSLIEEFQRMRQATKGKKEVSDGCKRRMKVLRSLADQFKDDCRIVR